MIPFLCANSLIFRHCFVRISPGLCSRSVSCVLLVTIVWMTSKRRAWFLSGGNIFPVPLTPTPQRDRGVLHISGVHILLVFRSVFLRPFVCLFVLSFFCSFSFFFSFVVGRVPNLSARGHPTARAPLPHFRTTSVLTRFVGNDTVAATQTSA